MNDAHQRDENAAGADRRSFLKQAVAGTAAAAVTTAQAASHNAQAPAAASAAAASASAPTASPKSAPPRSARRAEPIATRCANRRHGVGRPRRSPLRGWRWRPTT